MAVTGIQNRCSPVGCRRDRLACHSALSLSESGGLWPRNRRPWPALIRRVYEVNPLVCPACEGRMAILAFIEQEDVIFPIFRRLGLLADGVEPAEEGEARDLPPLR